MADRNITSTGSNRVVKTSPNHQRDNGEAERTPPAKLSKRRPKEQVASPPGGASSPGSSSEPGTAAKKKRTPERKPSAHIAAPTTTSASNLASTTTTTTRRRKDSSSSSSGDVPRGSIQEGDARNPEAARGSPSSATPLQAASAKPAKKQSISNRWPVKIQCSHYLEKDSGSANEVINRGTNRRNIMTGIRTVVSKGRGDALFRDPECRPDAWIKEFRHSARALLQPVRQAMQEEAAKAEVQAAIRPAINRTPVDMSVLTSSFSHVIKAWVGESNAEQWKKNISDGAKLRAMELLHEISCGVKQGKNATLDPGSIWKNALNDLLLHMIVDAREAPQPYANWFGYFLAAFLERPALPHIKLEEKLKAQFDKGVQSWAVTERVDHRLPGFDEAFAIDVGSMERKIAAAPSSDDWEQRVATPQKALMGASKKMAGDSIKDPRFYPVLRREFAAGSSTWYELVDGREVDITGKYDHIHALINTYGMQGEHTQVCMTQEHYQAGLNVLFGQAGAFSPYYDSQGRQLYPRYGAGVAHHVIHKDKESERIEVRTRVTCYVEYMVEKKSLQPRLLEIPGWLDFEIRSTVDKMGELHIQHVEALARNLHLLEDAFQELPTPFFQSTPRKAEKKRNRLSMPTIVMGSGERASDASGRRDSVASARRESVLQSTRGTGTDKVKEKEKEKS